MTETLYRDDFYTWTQEQAARIRALSGSHTFDVDLVAEEIESLGRSDLKAVENLLTQVLVHMIKLVHEPYAPAVNHWRGEIATFRLNASRVFSPGMRQWMNAETYWTDAWSITGAGTRRPNLAPPAACPFTVEDLMEKNRPIDPDVARITALIAAG